MPIPAPSPVSLANKRPQALAELELSRIRARYPLKANDPVAFLLVKSVDRDGFDPPTFRFSVMSEAGLYVCDCVTAVGRAELQFASAWG